VQRGCLQRTVTSLTDVLQLIFRSK